MLGNRLAHRLAELGVFRRQPQRSFGKSDTTRRDVDTAEFEPAGCLKKALSLHAADKIVGGDAVILENQFGTIDGVIAEFLELLTRSEPVALGRDEQAHAFVARVGLRVSFDEQGETAAVDAVRNPRLGAVDDIVVAVTDGCGTDRLQVGPRVRLGQREAAANFAAGEFGQPLRLLSRRTKAFDGARHDKMRVENAGNRHPIRCDMRHNFRIGDGGQAETAIFLSDGRAEQPHFGHLGDEFGGPDVTVVVLHHDGADFFLNPFVDGF